MNQKGLNIEIEAIGNELRLYVEGVLENVVSLRRNAKAFPFDLLQSGELEEFVRKRITAK